MRPDAATRSNCALCIQGERGGSAWQGSGGSGRHPRQRIHGREQPQCTKEPWGRGVGLAARAVWLSRLEHSQKQYAQLSQSPSRGLSLSLSRRALSLPPRLSLISTTFFMCFSNRRIEWVTRRWRQMRRLMWHLTNNSSSSPPLTLARMSK